MAPFAPPRPCGPSPGAHHKPPRSPSQLPACLQVVAADPHGAGAHHWVQRPPVGCNLKQHALQAGRGGRAGGCGQRRSGRTGSQRRGVQKDWAGSGRFGRMPQSRSMECTDCKPAPTRLHVHVDRSHAPPHRLRQRARALPPVALHARESRRRHAWQPHGEDAAWKKGWASPWRLLRGPAAEPHLRAGRRLGRLASLQPSLDRLRHLRCQGMQCKKGVRGPGRGGAAAGRQRLPTSACAIGPSAAALQTPPPPPTPLLRRHQACTRSLPGWCAAAAGARGR